MWEGGGGEGEGRGWSLSGKGGDEPGGGVIPGKAQVAPPSIRVYSLPGEPFASSPPLPFPFPSRRGAAWKLSPCLTHLQYPPRLWWLPASQGGMSRSFSEAATAAGATAEDGASPLSGHRAHLSALKGSRGGRDIEGPSRRSGGRRKRADHSQRLRGSWGEGGEDIERGEQSAGEMKLALVQDNLKHCTAVSPQLN